MNCYNKYFNFTWYFLAKFQKSVGYNVYILQQRTKKIVNPIDKRKIYASGIVVSAHVSDLP